MDDHVHAKTRGPLSPTPASRSPLPISCFVITKNEADCIQHCIRSLIDWVDEVVVVDSGSTDATVELAKAAGARVIHNDWQGFGQQKRFAEEQCRNDWLLNLDADEVASADLETELRQLFASGEPRQAAFRMKVLIVYPGRARPRPFAKDHICIRLYDRRKARFKDSTLHDAVDPVGQHVGDLKSFLCHDTIRSFDKLMHKCDERARYAALHTRERSVAALLLRATVEWPWVFTKYYLLRRHFTAGMDGIRYSAIMAHYRLLRIIRMLANSTATTFIALSILLPDRIGGFAIV